MPEYPRIDVAELSDTPNPTAHKKELDEALGIDAFGFNVYVARSGERLPWGYHYHPDHEELLYVLEGELAIETRSTGGDDGGPGDASGENDREKTDAAVRLAAGEALFIPPGAPQCARAVGGQPARVIAAGAPKKADGAMIEEYCPTCEARTDRTYDAREDEDGTSGSVYVLSCGECGTETDRFRAGP
jgi:mannose-6-phosphate isomerase-like protein (cupin superfamily)